jgi:Zn-dependent peptidase ImmA (M78 family)
MERIALARITEEASSVHSRYGAEDLDAVAKQLGLPVYDFLETEDLKEAYFPRLQAITLKPGLPRHERRYLIAHAIGHHLFHREGPARDYIALHKNGVAGLSEAERIEMAHLENEADLFAACLLVPLRELEPLLVQGWSRDSDDLVQQLSLEFQVPPEAMRVRLVYEKCRRIGYPNQA